MKLFLVHRPTVLAGVSPYRLLDEKGQGERMAHLAGDNTEIERSSP